MQEISIVPTMKDRINDDAIWCITFELAWNELQSKILENKFECNEKNEIINNLMLSTKGKDCLSEDDYYKAVGRATNKLKEKIKTDLYKKFNENSDIIDELKFYDDENTDNLLIYTMLKKLFSFEYEFEELGKSTFGKNSEVVDFFGISENNEEIEKYRQQVEVLFYNSKLDYAIIIHTDKKENLIFYRTDENKIFEETFDEIIDKTKRNINYSLKKTDTIKIPNIMLKIKKEYKELENKIFVRESDRKPFIITKAMQNIDFELDKKGGKVKSEAAIEMREGCIFGGKIEKEEPRQFNFDDSFYLYLVEEKAERPYLAMKINDIKKFI